MMVPIDSAAWPIQGTYTLIHRHAYITPNKIPNKVRSQNCRPIVDFQRVFERFELYLGSANGLGDFFLEALERRKQLTEEVFDHVDDKRLGTGQREVDQRLTGRPRLPRFILLVLVRQLLYNVQQYF